MCVNVEMNPQNMCVDVEMNPQHILRIVCWVIEAHSPNNSCIVCVDVEMSPQYILCGYRSSPSKHLERIYT